MVSDRFNELEDKISLDELFRRITGLAGIRYVRLEDHDGSAEGDFRNVRILESSSGMVAETRLRLKNRALVIGMGCELYDGRMAENRRQWMLFSIIVLGAGILCSYLLYGFQKSHLEMVRKMDQRLAREREDAALGRATAAITHEIRNPLNAISMGLQRLSIEAESLDEDHRGLIRDLLESVGRTDRIITDLKRFTGPLSLNVSVFSLGKIVETAASPYRGRIRDMGIVLTLPDPSFRDRVQADRDYCQILVGNLVKNAVEALAEDTDIKNRFISIDLEQSESSLTLVIRNSGFTGDPVHPEKILEPYVTTKTRGTGVGLAIVKRITEAHGGEIRLAVPGEGILEIRVDLPKAT
jgi:signal transduction histidine kinase